MVILVFQAFIVRNAALIIPYPQAQHAHRLLADLQRNQAQGAVHSTPGRSTMHDDTLHDMREGGRGARIILIETHASTVGHHHRGDGLLVGRERDLLGWLVGARLDRKLPVASGCRMAQSRTPQEENTSAMACAMVCNWRSGSASRLVT